MADNEKETAAPQKEYILRILSGPHTGAEVALSQDKKLVLGKGEDCDIVLKDDRLADQHALFSFQEDHFVCTPTETAEITIDGEVIHEAKALKNFAAIVCGSTLLSIGPSDIVWPNIQPYEAKATVAKSAPETPQEEKAPQSVPVKKALKDLKKFATLLGGLMAFAIVIFVAIRGSKETEDVSPKETSKFPIVLLKKSIESVLKQNKINSQHVKIGLSGKNFTFECYVSSTEQKNVLEKQLRGLPKVNFQSLRIYVQDTFIEQGLRLSTDKKTQTARELLGEMKAELKQNYEPLLQSAESEQQRIQQRALVDALKQELTGMNSEKAKLLLPLTDFLVEKSVWTIGGDGWAYDIGFGGLDHVLASGRNINVLVLDTEVYSNTGGQQSKSTPIGAVAKFAAAGKERAKKDLGLLAMMYGHVYVAQIALQANPTQAIKALQEANSYAGPSLIIAYSNCIEHGYDLRFGAEQQRLAVESGYWPLYRFDPRLTDRNPLQLDAVEAKIPLSDYLARENRFKVLAKTNPERAAALMDKAQKVVQNRIDFYKRLAQ